MTTGRIPQATMSMSELSEARANYFFFGNIIQEEFPKALRQARSLNSGWSGTITELQNKYRRFNRAEMHPKTFNEFLDRARDAFTALGVSTGSLDATTKFSVVNEFSAVGLQSLTELAGLQGASGKDSYHGFRVHTYEERENNSNIWIRGQYLGGGSFGKVYALTHYSTETKVAMKIVEIEPPYTQITMDFQNKIDILSKLRHERIVSYHGSEQKSNHFYLFMDFMAGDSLHDYIKSKGELDESLSRKYTRQILEGVYYLHSNKIVHGDIKGSNVFLDSNGNVKLADFGISRLIQRIASKTDLVHYVGTPYWMAPEILWEKGYGRKFDICSVGCTVVEMLTGHSPFGHLELHAAMFPIVSKPFQPKLPEHVSQDAIDFVQATLIWLPTERPECEELLHHTFIQPIDSAHWQVAPQHQQGRSPEVAAATTSEPLSELKRREQMTTNEKVPDPVCKDDISRDPADDVMENIVKATKNFEADHEECMRVLPYLEGGQKVVRFYVFSGESGIPKLLEEDAKKRFGGMEIKMNWLDLYNNVSNILKATPLKFQLGEQPKRLDVSEVDKISKIINKNLAVFHQHRNVTSVQASFKITGSKQTDKPCITIYVLGKGFIPFGEFEFPHTIGGYLVDVVDGFWFRTANVWEPNTAQEQSEVLCWGSSIGVQGKEASGTLGAIVEGGSALYALSCDHVMRHGENKNIIHPGWGDYLNYLKYHLNMYRTYIKRSTQCHCSETNFSVENLTDSELSDKFKKLKTFKDTFNKPEGGIKWMEDKIKEHEKKITNGLREPRVIGNYTFGVYGNVKWPNGNEYFVDAAIAELKPDEENRLRESKTPNIIGNPNCPSGDCSEVENEYIRTVDRLCKSGRTTCYTETCSLDVGADPPIFMKLPYCRKNGVLYDVGNHDFFCQTCAKQQLSQSKMVPCSENPPSCGSCAERAASMYNEHWLKNCLCIVQGTKDFALEGDSGAVIFEQKDLIGFGIITAIHKSTHQSCVVATPLKVALEALSKKISEESNLKLVSSYGTTQNQTPSPE